VLKRKLVTTNSSRDMHSSDSESSSDDVNSVDQPKSPRRSSDVENGKQALNHNEYPATPSQLVCMCRKSL